MSNSKDSTMVELVTNHLLNYSIRSVNTFSCHKTVNSDNVLTYIRSTFAVASSITRILFLLNSALARHINCLWPTLKLEPPSDTSASNLLFKFAITSFNWTYTMSIKTVASLKEITSCSTSHNWWSLCSSNGSKLYLTVPLNSTGSCISYTHQ